MKTLLLNITDTDFKRIEALKKSKSISEGTALALIIKIGIDRLELVETKFRGKND